MRTQFSSQSAPQKFYVNQEQSGISSHLENTLELLEGHYYPSLWPLCFPASQP